MALNVALSHGDCCSLLNVGAFLDQRMIAVGKENVMDYKFAFKAFLRGVIPAAVLLALLAWATV